MTDSKICTKCDEVKPYAEFHHDKRRRDGRHQWCKACCRERDRKRGTQKRTPLRMLRVRANNRALAALRELHREEYEAIFANELANAIEQSERWQEEMAELGRPAPADDEHEPAPIPLLKPGPAVAGEHISERLRADDGPSCRLCSNRHKAGHVCPACGSRPQVVVDVGQRRFMQVG